MRTTVKTCVNSGSELKKLNSNSLLKMIMQALMSEIVPMIPISTVIIALGIKMRPGLSAGDIAEDAMTRCSDAGIPMGDLYGETNKFAKGLQASSDAMTDALKNKSRVDGVVQPGQARTYVSTVGISGPQTGSGVNLGTIGLAGIVS